MNNKTKGAIAGVAGIALIAGGGTFALWSDSASVEDQVITAGHLGVELAEEPSWQDVSDDRADAPQAIDVETFRIIPGDTVEGRFEIDAALQGENMIADLGFTVADSTDVPEDLWQGLKVTYTVLDADGVQVASPTDVSTPTPLRLRSSDNGAVTDAGIMELPRQSLDGDADLTAVVTAAFDETIDEQKLTRAQAQLSDLAVTLAQRRGQ